MQAGLQNRKGGVRYLTAAQCWHAPRHRPGSHSYAMPAEAQARRRYQRIGAGTVITPIGKSPAKGPPGKTSWGTTQPGGTGMARLRVCNVPGCPEITTSTRCQTHTTQADRARGTAATRGYNNKHHKAFRTAVLERDQICTVCQLEPATIADLHPHSRRDLEQLGLNPNDPQHGRGLCHNCHSKETATNQPGGWHRIDQ